MILSVEPKKISKSNDFPHQAFVLALIIICAYLLFFGIIIYLDKDKEYEGLKILSSTLGILAAGVVGYYFGNKPVQEATQDAKTSRNLLKRENVDEISEIDQGIRYYKKLFDSLSGKSLNTEGGK